MEYVIMSKSTWQALQPTCFAVAEQVHTQLPPVRDPR